MPERLARDTVVARQSRGDEAAVRAAVLTVAALSIIKLDSQGAREYPPLIVWEVLDRFLLYWKAVYPDDEIVQSALLDIKDDENSTDSMLIDSDLFTEYYIRLPFYDPLPDTLDETSVLAEYLRLSVSASYTCWSQACVTASNELTLGDLPSVDEFEELVHFLAPAESLCELVAALEWLLDSEVPFGVTDDAEYPGLVHMTALESHQTLLRPPVTDPPQGGRVDALKNLLRSELRLMAVVVRASASVYFKVDESQELNAEESVLAQGFNTALLPTVRVIAAEHLGYIRNRHAKSTGKQQIAIRHYSEAYRVAHFAFNTSGRARYAKYVAQNLLEIAIVRNDSRCRRLAEIAWVDAYVMPYVMALKYAGDAHFSELGWTRPVFAVKTGYESIPPYSVEPDFVYTGAGARLLRGVLPSFTSDLWAASVLLVQHFKDLSEPARRLQPDGRLALFVPSSDQEAKFPLHSQHPVAWLYYFAEALLVEHQTQHLHAGLLGANRIDFWYCQWFRSEVQRAFQGTEEPGPQRLAPRKFPRVANSLIRSGRNIQDETSAEALIWSDVATKWDF